MEMHKKLRGVGVESNVGSKSVLASIQKQPHTETTLQHHSEWEGADDIFPNER